MSGLGGGGGLLNLEIVTRIAFLWPLKFTEVFSKFSMLGNLNLKLFEIRVFNVEF